MTDNRWQGKTHAQLRENQTSWVDQQTVTERCTHCEWQWDGTAVEGRQKALEHRTRHHPELTSTRRRYRPPVGADTPQKLADARERGTRASSRNARQ